MSYLHKRYAVEIAKTRTEQEVRHIPLHLLVDSTGPVRGAVNSFQSVLNNLDEFNNAPCLAKLKVRLTSSKRCHLPRRGYCCQFL